MIAPTTTNAGQKRRPKTPAPAGRRITLARVIMWLMGLAMVGFIAVFVFQISLFESTQQSIVADKPIEDPKASVAREVSFTGYDSDNQPFTIKALRAVQDKTAPARVFLETVTIEMKLKTSGDLLRVTADKGTFDDKSKVLDLAGNIVIVNSSNYTAHMESAQVLLRDKRLTSGSPVEVRFPTGTIKAGGMEMRDDGQQVYFTDTARAIFSERSAREDASKRTAP